MDFTLAHRHPDPDLDRAVYPAWVYLRRLEVAVRHHTLQGLDVGYWRLRGADSRGQADPAKFRKAAIEHFRMLDDLSDAHVKHMDSMSLIGMS